MMSMHSPRILEIFTGTWNMGNAEPDAEALEQFVPHRGGPFDILAIGLQESNYKVASASSAKSADQQPGAIGSGKTSSFMENVEKAFDPSITHLTQQICAILGPEYHVVDHANRYQMQLLVFAHSTVQKSIKHVEKSVENTGILHVLPNKGGLCISFTVDETKVTCTTGWHQHRVTRRPRFKPFRNRFFAPTYLYTYHPLHPSWPSLPRIWRPTRGRRSAVCATTTCARSSAACARATNASTSQRRYVGTFYPPGCALYTASTLISRHPDAHIAAQVRPLVVLHVARTRPSPVTNLYPNP